MCPQSIRSHNQSLSHKSKKILRGGECLSKRINATSLLDKTFGWSFEPERQHQPYNAKEKEKNATSAPVLTMTSLRKMTQKVHTSRADEGNNDEAQRVIERIRSRIRTRSDWKRPDLYTTNERQTSWETAGEGRVVVGRAGGRQGWWKHNVPNLQTRVQ